MPQMAPLNWLSLMITFTMILVTFSIANYYLFSYNPKQEKTKIKKTLTNWKW